ncbi:DUF1573 domain-containing protein [uncultured Polaribacter sp.]|uniref:DUF1573 domain-containing protein n=1 Tax=uncultured Polaribacter sp. TaxID=174711 RepID=UPI00262484AA|nr:DUF1573 domain-containing protein [uncultured Polaribacter sp.]
MKTYFTLLLIFTLSLSFNAQEFKFEKETIDYGKIAKGSERERTFVFTNIGDQPLIIKNIKSSCGCTIPEKPKEPVMPGAEGKIKVSYNTNRLGGFSKSITIFSNAKSERKIIKIKGFVDKGISLEKEKSLLSEN